MDSESTDPGSNPGRPNYTHHWIGLDTMRVKVRDKKSYALVAQWIAHWTSNPEVAGSNPVKSVLIVVAHVQ